MSHSEFSLCKTLPCHSLFSTKSVTDSNPSWLSRDSSCKEKGMQICTKALIIELFLQKGLQKSRTPLSTSWLAPAMPPPVHCVLQFESLKSKEILWNTLKEEIHRKMQKLKPVHLFQQQKMYFQAFGVSMSAKPEKGQRPLESLKRHQDSFLLSCFGLVFKQTWICKWLNFLLSPSTLWQNFDQHFTCIQK